MHMVDNVGGFPIMEDDLALDPEYVLLVQCATSLVAKGMSEHAAVQSVRKIMDAATKLLYSEDGE